MIDTWAAFAYMYVYQGSTIVWQGNLNSVGCATMSLAPNTAYAF